MHLPPSQPPRPVRLTRLKSMSYVWRAVGMALANAKRFEASCSKSPPLRSSNISGHISRLSPCRAPFCAMGSRRAIANTRIERSCWFVGFSASFDHSSLCLKLFAAASTIAPIEHPSVFGPLCVHSASVALRSSLNASSNQLTTMTIAPAYDAMPIALAEISSLDSWFTKRSMESSRIFIRASRRRFVVIARSKSVRM